MKKYVIFCCIIVTFCFVLGLSDRMNYDGFQTAVGMIQNSTECIEVDFLKVKTLTTVLSIYSTDRYGYFQYYNDTQNPDYYAKITYFSSVDELGEIGYYEMIDENIQRSQWDQVSYLVDFATHNPLDNDFLSVLSNIGQVIKIIISIIICLCSMLFDVIQITFGVIKAGLYLLGF